MALEANSPPLSVLMVLASPRWAVIRFRLSRDYAAAWIRPHERALELASRARRIARTEPRDTPKAVPPFNDESVCPNAYSGPPGLANAQVPCWRSMTAGSRPRLRDEPAACVSTGGRQLASSPF